MTNLSAKTLRGDLLAGLTVALLTVPQTMAYALIAGLPLSTGLFAAIFSAMVATTCGSSRHLVLGPSNAIAILIQAGTAEVLFTYFRHLTGFERDLMALQILTQLTLLVGVFQLIAAVCKLGRLTNFVSHSVVVGYLIGVAFAVFVNQSYTFLGIPRYDGIHSLYDKAVHLLGSFDLVHLPTAIIGGISLVMLIILQRIDKRIPAGVLTFFVAGALVYGYDALVEWGYLSIPAEMTAERTHTVLLVGDTGDIPHIIPSLALPSFNMKIMSHLLPFAFAVSLVSVLESTSVAKSLAATTGQRLSVNQEIFGLGMGNVVSSLIGAMPISGSPSRSVLNYMSGARTRFAAIFGALFVGLLAFLFAPLITRIPLAALAALILLTSVRIVNIKHAALCLRATKSDAFVLVVTALSCLFFNLDVAFYIGVALSITLYLKKAADPQLVQFCADENGVLTRLNDSEASEDQKIRIIKVEGELFFGAADIFQSTLKTIAKDDKQMRVIILQLKNARDIDATACLALKQLHGYLHHSGRHLILCGITDHVATVLHDSGIYQTMGAKTIYPFNEFEPQGHMVRALEYARELAKMQCIQQEEDEEVVEAETPKILSIEGYR
ncbi:MAG: SulP family inorganic anion transporter [Chlamydiales bacterium]|nr:SulP family inorganic anion transporter [Chlamydiales bacterium]